MINEQLSIMKEKEVQAIAHIENALKQKKIDAFENPRAFYINI